MIHWRNVVVLVLAFFLCAPSSAFSDSDYRGFILGPGTTLSDLDDLGDGQEFEVNFVGYQLVWAGEDADTATLSEYNSWLSGALDHFDTLKAALAAKGIRVMLVLHTTPGGFASRTAPALHNVFSTSEWQQALIDTWETIATRYNGDSDVWGYDIFNEPAHGSNVADGLKSWPDLALDVIAAIRAIDSTKVLGLEPNYGNQAKIGALKFPEDTANLRLIVHPYTLIKYVQQGLYDFTKSVNYPQKVGKRTKNKIKKCTQLARDRYKGKKKKIKRKNKIRKCKAGNGTWRQLSLTKDGPYLGKAIKWSLKNAPESNNTNSLGIEVIVGEFGCARWAPGAVQWMQDIIDIFELYNFDWIIHGFRESKVPGYQAPWSFEHTSDKSDSDPSSTETDREALLKSYFENNSFD